jgi:hypothetical protein
MPVDPTTDPDFMKAPPHEQMAYLTQTDSDFAKASPQDQLGYLAHIHGFKGEMAGPAGPSAIAGTAQPGKTSPAAARTMHPVDITGEQQTPESATAGLPGYTGFRPVKDRDLIPGAIAGGAAAAYAAPVVAAPIVRAGAKYAQEHPYKTMAALELAKQIPGVGPYVSKIPTWLPLLAGGHEEAEPEPNVPAPPLRWSPRSIPEEPVTNTPPPPLRWSGRVATPAEEADPTPATSTQPPVISGDPLAGRLSSLVDKIKTEGHGHETPEPEEATPQTTNLNEDLTPALKASLRRVRAAKAARSGKSN